MRVAITATTPHRLADTIASVWICSQGGKSGQL